MGVFEDFLLSGPSQSGVSAEVLELLGRKAAMDFLKNGVSLNDAVRKAISEHGELGNEHIKRVVEFANNVAFQELFQASEDKNIHFDIADPGVVIRDAKDGGSPAHDGKAVDSSKDYHQTPSQTLEKQQFGDAESGMAHLSLMNGQDGRMGQGEQIAKQASTVLSPARPADWRHEGLDEELLAQFTPRESTGLADPNHSEHADPVENVYALHTKLAATRRQLGETHETIVQLIKTAREDTYQAIKHEVMDPDGPGLDGVVQVLAKLAEDSGRADLVEMYVPEMMERLVREEVPAERLQLHKTAAKAEIINYRHPLVQAWSGLVKAAEEYRRATIALHDLEAGLAQTKQFLGSLAG